MSESHPICHSEAKRSYSTKEQREACKLVSFHPLHDGVRANSDTSLNVHGTTSVTMPTTQAPSITVSASLSSSSIPRDKLFGASSSDGVSDTQRAAARGCGDCAAAEEASSSSAFPSSSFRVVSSPNNGGSGTRSRRTHTNSEPGSSATLPAEWRRLVASDSMETLAGGISVGVGGDEGVVAREGAAGCGCVASPSPPLPPSASSEEGGAARRRPFLGRSSVASFIRCGSHGGSGSGSGRGKNDGAGTGVGVLPLHHAQSSIQHQQHDFQHSFLHPSATATDVFSNCSSNGSNSCVASDLRHADDLAVANNEEGSSANNSMLLLATAADNSQESSSLSSGELTQI